MGTRTNFYKNAAYAYAKEFGLSSTLENLKAYNDATREAGPQDFHNTSNEVRLPQHSLNKNTGKRKRLQSHEKPRSKDSFSVEEGTTSHALYVSKSKREVDSRPGNFTNEGIPKATSVLGFEPYEMHSEKTSREKAGKVEVLCGDLVSHIFGTSFYGEDSDDEALGDVRVGNATAREIVSETISKVQSGKVAENSSCLSEVHPLSGILQPVGLRLVASLGYVGNIANCLLVC